MITSYHFLPLASIEVANLKISLKTIQRDSFNPHQSISNIENLWNFYLWENGAKSLVSNYPMQLEVPTNHIYLYACYAAWLGPEAVPTQRTRCYSRVLQLWIGTDQTVIPGARWPPTAHFYIIISGGHRDSHCSIAVDIVAAVLIYFPYFDLEPRPSSYILCDVMNIERLLNRSDSIVSLSLKCLEFGIAWEKFPFFSLN